MNLRDFKLLSFDCYGTLIDWEKGIVEALGALLSRAGVAPGEALECFGEHETAVQYQFPSMRCPEVLAAVHRRLAADWGAGATEEESSEFGRSIGRWPAFPDSYAALRELGRHFRLAILSNVDRASFAKSEALLGVRFDAVWTAEEIGSYKPNLQNFQFLIDQAAEIGIRKHEILHVAQSLYHDHVPANELGLASAWIDRPHVFPGAGATKIASSRPTFDFRFVSLAEMASAIDSEPAELEPR